MTGRWWVGDDAICLTTDIDVAGILLRNDAGELARREALNFVVSCETAQHPASPEKG